MRIRRLVPVALALVVAGCPARPREPIPEAVPGPIQVVVFAGPEHVDSYDGPTDDVGADFARQVVATLLQRGRDAVVVTTPPERGTVVHGTVVRVDGGSHGLRFWIGMGVGRASVSVAGETVRPDGRIAGTFRVRRSASGETSLGFAGDESLVRGCIEVLAKDVALMIESGRYRTSGDVE